MTARSPSKRRSQQQKANEQTSWSSAASKLTPVKKQNPDRFQSGDQPVQLPNKSSATAM
jgi:hypothetical protein